MKKYDYLIVGAGLFGAVFAHEATRRGKTCLVIDKRGHIGGNIYTEEVEGIQVHRYGAHIFHTSRKQVWDYINQFAEFNHFVNSPIAVYKDELYNLPFNMNTFHQLWGVRTPAEAKAKIQEQIARMHITHPKNLEEQALALVGQDVYEKLVEGYTRKQWGRECKDLPAFIIKRLPLRYTYDNNYFKDPYQGIPKGGYTRIVKKLLEGVQVCLNTDFFANREELTAQAEKKLETDRRLIRTRISALKQELSQVEKHRELIRSSRARGNMKTAAIVGYTNAGKSTLLNTLTGSEVLSEDKLFATLDPTTRLLNLKDGQQILLTDTVGFIHKLPHNCFLTERK